MRQPQRLILPFPNKGIHEALALRDQPERTAVDMQNVRAFDPSTGRSRGAQRAGMSKYLSPQHPAGANVIQDINHVVSIQTGEAIPSSTNIRTVTPLAVSQGTVESFDTSAFSTPDNAITVRTFDKTVPEYFTHADHADFSTGDIDFTWVTWAWFEEDGTDEHLIAKMDPATYEYDVHRLANNTLRARINGFTGISVTSGTDTYLSVGWHFVIFEHNASADTIRLITYTGAATNTYSAATGGTAPNDLAHPLTLGYTANGAVGFTGNMKCAGFWKRILTSAEHVWLSNQGVGRLYASIGVAGTGGSDLKTSLMAYYNLNETSGNAIDSHTSSLDLTDTGTVGSTTSDLYSLSNTAPVIFSAPHFGDLYYADGRNERYYDTSTDKLEIWSASAGALPDDSGNKPRLIELWRSRLVLSGVITDPHNWYMSAVGDPSDFDYTVTPITETIAVAGNNSDAGKIGDVVNTMLPYNDDVLIFGCDQSIWLMSGDPQSGGRLDLLSDITGMSFGRPWCKDPSGLIYFFGSRGGVYRLAPGGQPERITAGVIDERLATVDLNTHLVRLAWNDREVGVHVFITPLTATTAFHYFYDARNEAWFVDRFADENHSPVSVHVYDGDDPGDRAILLGGRDGYIRKWDIGAIADDGVAIDSSVTIGPIEVDGGNKPFVLSGMQAVLSDESGTVSYDLFAGDSPEDVFDTAAQTSGQLQSEAPLLGPIILEDGTGFLSLEGSTVARTGSFTSGSRSRVHNPRLRAYAAYLRLYNTSLTEKWAMENVFMDLSVIVSSHGRGL